MECVIDIFAFDALTCAFNDNHILDVMYLDIGCGTGAIGISLLAHLPQARCVALDINPTAVQLASKNANRLLPLTDHHRYTPLLQSFESYSNDMHARHSFDLIVSNPPYIPSSDIASLDSEVRIFEDHQALDGGHDGLHLAREIISKSPQLLKTDSVGELWMELSRQHPKEIETWIGQGGPHSENMQHVANIDDFTNNPRFVRLKLRK